MMDDETDAARFDDETLFHDVVERLTPEEITHTLTKSPHWDDERAGDITVFRPRDGGQPVVYDPDDRAFLPEDVYRRTVDSVRRAATDEAAFVEMLSEVDGAVAKRDVLMHFNAAGPTRRTSAYAGDPCVDAMGFAVDGEGYTLGRISTSEPGTDTYAVVRSTYTPGGAEHAVPGTRITVDRGDVPHQHTFFYKKVRFLDDHLLSAYSENRDQALAMIGDAYSRPVDL